MGPGAFPRIFPRLLAGFGVLLGVVTLTFLLLHLAPGDPASQLAGPAATPEQIANLRTALGLDRPLLVQYATWLIAFVQGDWGSSISTGRPVSAMLGAAWPATALLVVL
ncbi:MAG TPA: ABC transporter permease, partial [Gemmatimonadales bacterium]|nr:ABC transporter permease [Gemmatimonadales bacterium]